MGATQRSGPRVGTGGRWATLGADVMIGLLAASCASSQPADNAGGSPATSQAPAPGRGGVAGPSDGTSPRDGGGVVFAIEAEPEGLDPTRYVFAGSGHYVASAVFDSLATLDENGRAVPYLASAIEASDDNRTWTITLPTGVKFHDGSDLTAQVVVDNLEAYRKSYVTQLAFQTVTTIEATDTSHVVVKLDRPWAAFPTAMTSQLGYVLAEAMLQDPSLVNSPIGTGPFVFDKMTKNVVWSFRKNPDYWRKGADGSQLPHLDQIDFRPMPDNAERVAALQRGDVDIVATLRPDQVLALQADQSLKRVENRNGEEDFLIINTEKAPFDRLEARQALAYATDVARWREELQKGVEQPANSPFAPGQPGFLEDNGSLSYDPDKAKELVARVEQETGQPFAFEYVTSEDVTSQADAQFFKTTWEAAGMEVTIKTLPQINQVALEATGAYQVGIFRNFGFPDVDTDTPFWRSTSVLPPPNVSLNFSRFKDQRVDDAIDRATASADPATRDEAYQTVNRIWAENIPYIWLGRPVWILAAQPDVNGIYAGANGSVQTIGSKTWLADLWLSR